MERVRSLTCWEVARLETPPDAPGSPLPPLDRLDWIPAAVPGAVHYDLVAAGLLRNPFESRESAFAAEWVAQSDWVYRTSFELSEEEIRSRDFLLEVDGIDTFADLRVDGHLVGRTANAYREYRFPFPREALSAGAHLLVVHVQGHERAIAPKMEAARRMGRPDGVGGLFGKSLIRRYQRSFYAGSSLLNLGTGILGIGIFRPVRLRAVDRACLESVGFRTPVVTDASAEAVVRVEARRFDATTPLPVRVELTGPDGVVHRAEACLPPSESVVRIPLVVPRPRRWWPVGYGPQDLYRLTVRLVADGREVDAVDRTVGFRTVELEERTPEGRPAFRLRVNGTPVFVRGQNLIPVDYLKVYGRWSDTERLLRLAAHQGCNLVRVWGGGMPDDPRFYDRCDELGLLLFQEFFLHSDVYPDDDPDFVEDFRRECVGVARKVGTHPSLAILCGGNELQEGWDEWGWKDETDRHYGVSLARDLGREVARAEAPDVPYVWNSPHGGKWAQSPTEGDMHCWGNYYNATKDPLFVTETVWHQESYSRPETLAESMGLDVDDERFGSFGWSREWTRRTGLPLVIRLPFSNHFDVRTLRTYLRSLEVEQERADYQALNQLRMRNGSLSGLIYWSLDKGGPLFGIGCVDYGGRPLMSYYAVKRLFADVCVHAYRDLDDLRVVGSNLRGEALHATLVVAHFETTGRRIEEWRRVIVLEPGRPRRLLDLEGRYRDVSDRTREFVHVRLDVDGTTLCEDFLYFCPYSEVAQGGEPRVVAIEADSRDGGSIELEADGFVQMVQLEGDRRVVFDDDYFPMAPGTRRRIRVRLLEPDGGTPAITLGRFGSDAVRRIL